jgi:hypothetical protein
MPQTIALEPRVVFGAAFGFGVWSEQAEHGGAFVQSSGGVDITHVARGQLAGRGWRAGAEGGVREQADVTAGDARISADQLTSVAAAVEQSSRAQGT